MEILGVKIDNLPENEILGKVRMFLDELKFHQIATINPEIILEAQKNQEYKNILNNCDLNVVDGFGIKLAFLRFGKKLKYRFTGSDLMLEILKIANEKNLSIFLATNKNGLSSWKETRDAILKIYPDLEIDGDDITPGNNAYKLKAISYQLLFCNFGAPHQEIFINSVKCDTIRLAMGVGGSFDYLTAKLKRAPKFMRLIGLEWLWRLILQPRRFRRIWNAVIIFPIKIIFNNKKL